MENVGYKIRKLLGLSLNYFIDYLVYIKESGIIQKNTEEKLLAFITFTYHTLEKGMSMPKIRYGFGQKKIETLLNLIKEYYRLNYNVSRSQFIAACSVLSKYYQLHLDAEYDIHKYFNQNDYSFVSQYAHPEVGGAITIKKDNYFPDSTFDFETFAKSRHSVRYFSNEFIEADKVARAVEIANYCPSACNRQSSRAYLVNNKEMVQDILGIQKGVLATSEYIHQLIVVTSNRNYFFTSGERTQLFVDGGIFLESLLLSLHNEGVAVCTLHWSLNRTHDAKIKKILDLSKGEKVIALLAIGKLDGDINVPASHRKSINELLVIKS
ncbi:MAG: nitroreductase family protein [Dysgonamonadaceae bacterium]